MFCVFFIGNDRASGVLKAAKNNQNSVSVDELLQIKLRHTSI
jgi:hypothetical protein